MTTAVRLVESGAQLAELEPAWRLLWERTPDATPFQHPAWLAPWWRHLGKGALRTFVAERDGELLGVLPLCAVAEHGQVVLRPLGFDISDYAEPLIGPDERHATFAALAGALAEAQSWDVCAFVLRAPVPFGDLPSGYGLRARRTPLEAAPVLDLRSGYPDCLPGGIRKSLAEAQRRIGITPLG